MKALRRCIWVNIFWAAVLATNLCAQTSPPASSRSGQSQNTTVQTRVSTKAHGTQLRNDPGGTYRNWAGKDVAHIITDIECSASLTPQPDESHETLTGQSWLQPNPTPGTTMHECEEEHHRRFAYANEHFASKVPGWMTDRGRIYIIWANRTPSRPIRTATLASTFLITAKP